MSVLGCIVTHAETLRVGSKNFNESYILAEIMAQTLEGAGYDVERKFGLGGTLICYNALLNGEIDIYPEYTGTLAQAILKIEGSYTIEQLDRLVATDSLRVLPGFGFNNTYALGLAKNAKFSAIRNISDLAARSDLKLVFSHEFLERPDGWPGLARRYGFKGQPSGIEHGLAFQALANGEIDVTDVYSTDGEIRRYDLLVLEDDRNFFPSYLAFPFVKEGLHESVERTLLKLTGMIDDDLMSKLNEGVVFDGKSFSEVASQFLGSVNITHTPSDSDWKNDLLRNTATHLKLTGIALGLAIIAGLLISLAVFRIHWLTRGTLTIIGLLQTVPSIALLALMIPIFGIGQIPAIIALFLYSLLPIVRNAVTALTTIDPVLEEVSVAIGLTPREQLRYVFVPLSLPSMLAGVRTAAVISIGTATLAAFIGAGGLGDPIVVGLSLNDTSLILQGAIPAAMLALIVEFGFESLEKYLLPSHLR